MCQQGKQYDFFSNYCMCFSQLIARYFDCTSYLLLWSKSIHWSIQFLSVVLGSTRHLCNRGSQKGLPRALFALWNPPENKYLFLIVLPSFLGSPHPPKKYKLFAAMLFPLQSFCLLTLAEASLGTGYSNVQTEPDIFLSDILEEMRFCLLRCSKEEMFSSDPSCTQKFRGSLSLEGSIAQTRSSLADVQELLLLRLERLKSDHRMFGEIANRKWGLSNLWIILKWRSHQRHLLSSPAPSWRWFNVAVKQLLAGKADEQTKHHPSWRTTGEWKHSHWAICTHWLVFGIGFNQAKNEEQLSMKAMQGINVCKWGVYRRTE